MQTIIIVALLLTSKSNSDASAVGAGYCNEYSMPGIEYEDLAAEKCGCRCRADTPITIDEMESGCFSCADADSHIEWAAAGYRCVKIVPTVDVELREKTITCPASHPNGPFQVDKTRSYCSYECPSVPAETDDFRYAPADVCQRCTIELTCKYPPNTISSEINNGQCLWVIPVEGPPKRVETEVMCADGLAPTIDNGVVICAQPAQCKHPPTIKYEDLKCGPWTLHYIQLMSKYIADYTTGKKWGKRSDSYKQCVGGCASLWGKMSECYAIEKGRNLERLGIDADFVGAEIQRSCRNVNKSLYTVVKTMKRLKGSLHFKSLKDAQSTCRKNIPSAYNAIDRVKSAHWYPEGLMAIGGIAIGKSYSTYVETPTGSISCEHRCMGTVKVAFENDGSLKGCIDQCAQKYP